MIGATESARMLKPYMRGGGAVCRGCPDGRESADPERAAGCAKECRVG